MEACEYDWKPFFYFDKIVWVFFLRDRCSSKRGGCGKTCSQIDPRFLSSLPSSVAREFPFVSAGSRRIGMALPMLYSFIEMIGNGIQVGAFARIYNSLYQLNHDIESLSYYSNFRDLQKAGSMMPLPIPFGKFHSVGGYNGILISRGTIRKAVGGFYGIKE